MYPSGSLYTSNYSNRTLGVGRSQQGHDIFSTKPGIGPIDTGIENSSGAFASSARRSLGIPNRALGTTSKNDAYSLSNTLDPYSMSSTSILGKNLFDASMTEREATIYGGNPIWSDAGRNNYARDESNRNTLTKPLVGTIGLPLTDGNYNEDYNRLPAKFSPASRTTRKGCPDLAQRHPNGRPFANVTLSVPPQRQDEDSTHWHYDKNYNSSHGNIVPHRSTGGRYFKNSAVTGDTIMNTRTETINDREFFDMGTKPRTMYGGGYSRAVKAREDALLMQRGRLKKTERIPDDIMQATKDVLGKKVHNIVKVDPFNPKHEADNSAYVTPTAEWQSTTSWTNQNARTTLMNTQRMNEQTRVEEAQRRSTLFRR